LPAGDWIEKWTEMCVREMNTISETQKRYEDRQEVRMERLEQSISDMSKSNSEEFKRIYDKIDTVSNDLNTLINTVNEKNQIKIEGHTIDLASIKTSLGFYALVVTLALGALVTWVFGWILPGRE